MNSLDDELRLAKAAAKEWLDKFENSERRIVAVWDAALHEALLRIGAHNPRCYKPCDKCLAHDEISKLLRGDANNYASIKERLRDAAASLKETHGIAEDDFDTYAQGIDDLMVYVEKWISERE